MKQIQTKTLLAMAAIATLLLSGCTKEPQPQDEGGNSATGKMVSVTLPIGFDEIETTAKGGKGAANTAPLASRATAAKSPEEGFSVSFGEPEQGATAAAPATRAPETALTDVWVLQFNSAGKNVVTTNTGSLAAGTHLTVPSLQVGTGYTIYVVANGPASGLTTSNPATVADFEAKMLHTDAVTDATKLPMAGKLTDVTVVDMGDGKGAVRQLGDASAVIVLRRIHAELTLTVDFGVTDYTLTSAELYNVPVGATYDWNSAITTFPDNTVAANFGYTNASTAGMASLTPTTSGSKTTYKWFVGDNRRGEVSGLTAQTDRNSTKAPAYATFARVILTHSTTSTQKIYYDIYLGSGTLTNFDVMRNHTYTLTAAIKGTAAFQEALIDTDARVSGVGFPVLIYLTDSKADSPIAISPKSTESTTIMIWGTTTSIPAVQDIFNGKANTDAIMTTSATTYPAAKYCRDIGANYYLPSQAELMLMWIYQPAISAAGRPSSPNGVFWSSTEKSSDTSYAWSVNFLSGYTFNNFKTYTCRVRCVREL